MLWIITQETYNFGNARYWTEIAFVLEFLDGIQQFHKNIHFNNDVGDNVFDEKLFWKIYLQHLSPTWILPFQKKLYVNFMICFCGPSW